ncbi:MAG: hypothetical protein WCC17_08110 [Candidatus Nitrosopolaris sp.]
MLSSTKRSGKKKRRKEEKNALINTKHPGINYLFGIATMSHLKYESTTFPS